MAEIDWQSLWNSQNGGRQKKRYAGANVFFFNAYSENKEKSLKEGRPIFDEIPSISIQWPGGDVTVRRIEQQDIQEYPEKYAAFKAGNEPVESGTPLSEWPALSATVVKELQYFGIKTVEQLAEATDAAKSKLGTAGRFVKMAKDWLDAANSTQSHVAKLQQLLELETERRKKLEDKLEIFMQRVEANEGTDLRESRKEVIRFSEAVGDSLDSEETGIEVETLPRRGRPRKV